MSKCWGWVGLETGVLLWDPSLLPKTGLSANWEARAVNISLEGLGGHNGNAG